MLEADDTSLLVYLLVPKHNGLLTVLGAQPRRDQKQHVGPTDDLRMLHTALKGPVNAKAEGVDRVDHESFVGANNHHVLVVVERDVGNVLRFLELGAKSCEVSLRHVSRL